jgi:hypothetical protein
MVLEWSLCLIWLLSYYSLKTAHLMHFQLDVQILQAHNSFFTFCVKRTLFSYSVTIIMKVVFRRHRNTQTDDFAVFSGHEILVQLIDYSSEVHSCLSEKEK